jgi:hypothetical protein
MTINTEIEFQVDEQYENEKGVFTVISIHRDQMVIRWKNGEEIRTDIELQRNIQERRQWEQIQRAAARKNARTGSGSSKSARSRQFNGFETGDFKNSGSGTTWRGRSKLGGAIIRKMPADDFDFKSWAFSNKPEMHCMDSHHRSRSGASKSARFFVRLSQADLTYGFCVVSPKAGGNASQNWEAFKQWAKREENQRLLQTLAAENQVTIYTRSGSGLVKLKPSDDRWLLHEGNKTQPVDTVATFMENLPQKGSLALEVACKVDKADALARSSRIADDIAELFIQLMPLYRNAVVPDLAL